MIIILQIILELLKAYFKGSHHEINASLRFIQAKTLDEKKKVVDDIGRLWDEKA